MSVYSSYMYTNGMAWHLEFAQAFPIIKLVQAYLLTIVNTDLHSFFLFLSLSMLIALTHFEETPEAKILA